jgi:hypothetical protein
MTSLNDIETEIKSKIAVGNKRCYALGPILRRSISQPIKIRLYKTIITMMRTPRLPAVDWTDSPVDVNGLVRLGERWNVVSARVPSGYVRALPLGISYCNNNFPCHFYRGSGRRLHFETSVLSHVWRTSPTIWPCSGNNVYISATFTIAPWGLP